MGTTETKTDVRGQDAAKPKRPWLWNVVLLDDDDHTYDYVMAMCQEVFGHPEPRAYRIAQTVDGNGRAVLLTTHKELAELKVEQIRGFGADGAISECVGAMTAIIEPAEGGEDGKDEAGSK